MRLANGTRVPPAIELSGHLLKPLKCLIQNSLHAAGRLNPFPQVASSLEVTNLSSQAELALTPASPGPTVELTAKRCRCHSSYERLSKLSSSTFGRGQRSRAEPATPPNRTPGLVGLGVLHPCDAPAHLCGHFLLASRPA